MHKRGIRQESNRGSKYLTILMFHMINGYSNLVVKAHVDYERSMLQCCCVPGKKPLCFQMYNDAEELWTLRMVVWLAYSRSDFWLKSRKRYCDRGNLQLSSHTSLSFVLNLRPANYKAFGNHAHRIQARIQHRGSKYLRD